MTWGRTALVFFCSGSIMVPTAVASAGMPQSILQGVSISICGDENEWPPYTYYERVHGKKTGRLVGYSISVIDAIFSRNQISYSVHLLPWTRCIAEVKDSLHFQMILDMTANAERRAAFRLTRPYYTTNAHYFYSRRNYPRGLDVKELADLRHYSICGLSGYNYTQYGLKLKDIDQTANTYPAVIEKLHSGRCALFLEQYEAMISFSRIGASFLDDRYLANAPVPGIRPALFSMGISRKYPKAAILRSLIDRSLVQMEASGELNALWKMHSLK